MTLEGEIARDSRQPDRTQKADPAIVYLVATTLVARLPNEVSRSPGPVPSLTRLDGVVDDQLLVSAGLTWDRYLDRHRVIYDPRMPSTRLLAERYLYDTVAERYDEQIDAPRNRTVIRRLLRSLAPGKIIDFGCGTGISIDAANPAHHQLLGVDISPSMRRLARQRGLRAESIESLDTRSGEEFDGAFACYVLHLTNSHEHLPRLALSLRRGGRIAANFHKGHGLDEVDHVLLGYGYQIVARRSATAAVLAPEVVWERG